MTDSGKNTQMKQVLDYIEKNGSINPWQAMNELHIMRLGARIWDLKKSGVPIVTTIIRKTNPDGTVTRWAEYSIAA